MSYDDAFIAGFVSDCCRRCLGTTSAIEKVRRKASEYQSSCRMEEISVEISDGTGVELVLKDLAPESWLEDASRSRPKEVYKPQREIVIYRDLLSKAELGTAPYYGSLVDEESGAFLLLIERVRGVELFQSGDLSDWCNAAKWLAILHSHFADKADDLTQKAALPCYDESFYRHWLARAERTLQTSHAGGKAYDSGDLRRLLDRCREMQSVLANQSRTLIHGEFFPSNILLTLGGDSSRVCPIDWETASIGPGLFDLAQLVSGNWSDEHREAMFTVYCDSLRELENSVDYVELRCAFDACRLHNAMRWIGWSQDWTPPLEHQNDWLAEAMRLAA